MDLRFHRPAAQEFREARAWYERRRLGLGDDLRAEVDRAVGRLADEPGRWPVFRDRFRSIRVRRFPYRLYYALSPLGVLILAVAHDRRRPGYWMRRASTN